MIYRWLINQCKNVSKFKHFETAITNRDFILEVMGRFMLLSKNLKIKIYRTIIFPVVLYGCETWSLTLREERKLRVFENMVLRIFGPMRDEVKEECRRLHNEELNDLYSTPNIVRVIKSKRMR